MLDLALIALPFGIAGGIFLGGMARGKAKAEAAAKPKDELLRGELSSLRRGNADLQAELIRLREAERVGREEALRRRQYAIDNDVTLPENQMRNIEACELRVTRPVNKEAVTVLYVLENLIRTERKEWKLSFEVSMAAFVKTNYGADSRAQDRAFSAYSGKRVDFLLIDGKGFPKLAVEYNGTGHDLSDDAEDRMKVKRRVLERVGVPLLEIPAKTSKADMRRMVVDMLGAQASSSPVLTS